MFFRDKYNLLYPNLERKTSLNDNKSTSRFNGARTVQKEADGISTLVLVGLHKINKVCHLLSSVSFAFENILLLDSTSPKLGN